MIPTHELLWSCANGDLDESILKADKPKSNCGAGEKGNVGFQQDNDCAKKDGGGADASGRVKKLKPVLKKYEGRVAELEQEKDRLIREQSARMTLWQMAEREKQAALDLVKEGLEELRVRPDETNSELFDRIGKRAVHDEINRLKQKHNVEALSEEALSLKKETAIHVDSNFQPSKHRIDLLRAKSDLRDAKKKLKLAQIATNVSFQKWYGDSVNVDEEGLPLVIYHGTKAEGGVSEFDPTHDSDSHGVFGSTSIITARTYSGGYTDDVTPIEATSIDDIPNVKTVWGSRTDEGGTGFYSTKEAALQARQDLIIDHDRDFPQPEQAFKLYDEERPEFNKYYTGEFAEDDLLEEYNFDAWGRHRGPGVYPLFFKMKNPLVVDGKGRNWDNLPPVTISEVDETGDYLGSWTGITTRDISDLAMAEGYDGVIFKNIVDCGVGGDCGPADVYTSFDSKNIKSTHNAGTFGESGDILKSADKPKSDCGANAPGGGGFQQGNSCAKKDGDRDVDEKNLDLFETKIENRHLKLAIQNAAFTRGGTVDDRQVREAIKKDFEKNGYPDRPGLPSQLEEDAYQEALSYAENNEWYVEESHNYKDKHRERFSKLKADRKSEDDENYAIIKHQKQNVTKRQNDALADYASAGSGQMGMIMRGDVDPVQDKEFLAYLKTDIKEIDKVLESHSFDEDVRVYHGMEWKHVNVKSNKDLIGKTIHDPAFLSTTTRFETAERFDSKDWSKDDTIGFGGVIRLTIPKGTPALAIGLRNPNWGDREQEVLLGSNYGIKITAINDYSSLEEGKRGVVFDAELVDMEKSKEKSMTIRKSSDSPKSDCGAGREGSPGFELDNDCGSKEGGSSNASTSGERSKEFDEWFGDSKVVDENGDPLVVYHVTTEKFDEFDPDKSAMGGVFWFTSDKSQIESNETGAGLHPDKPRYVVEAHLSIKKMAGWDEYDKYGFGELEDMGFDGVKLDETFVVFESNQIKDIDNKNPTDDPSIHKSADSPKSDCGAGEKGNVGFQQGNDCSKKDGGESGEATSVNPKVLEWAKKEFNDEETAKRFAEWFGDSKVVDENGDPLVLYHGSAAENIEEFDVSRAGTVQRSDWGEGVYFTPDEGLAEIYSREAIGRSSSASKELREKEDKYLKENGGRGGMYAGLDLSAGRITQEVYDVAQEMDREASRLFSESRKKKGTVYSSYVRMDNPYYYTYAGVTDPYLPVIAKGQGHDGIIITAEGSSSPKDWEEVIVFDPKQIKSVDNEGTFDPDDPSIHKSSDKPKSDCGAGREGSPGFEQDNQCAKKDGGESGEATLSNDDLKSAEEKYAAIVKKYEEAGQIGYQEVAIEERIELNKAAEKLMIARLAQTKSFQNWFGNSKAVDDEGLPLVIYHGTSTGKFKEFHEMSEGDYEGVFGTTNLRMAASYGLGYEDDITPKLARSAEEMKAQLGSRLYRDEGKYVIESHEDDDGKTTNLLEGVSGTDNLQNVLELYNSEVSLRTRQGGQKAGRTWPTPSAGEGVYPLFYKLENPVVVDAQGRNFRNVHGFRTDRIVEMAQDNVDVSRISDDEFDSESSEYRRPPGSKPYDGVIIKNVWDYGDFAFNLEDYSGLSEPTGDVYIAFDNGDVKSIHNTGEFEDEDDILKSSDKPKSDCGANAPGGGGFQQDNSCSKKDGGESGDSKTEAFDEWFGESKVVDENGEPLVLYHGTPSGNFTEFKEGSHFTTNKEYADQYQQTSASSLGGKPKKQDAPETLAVHIKMERPFDTRLPKNREIFKKEFTYQWGNGTPLQQGLPDWTDGLALLEWIEETGQDFDGILLDEGGTPEGGSRSISYVPLSPNQIKDIDNKNPTDDPSIHKSADKPKSNCGAGEKGNVGFQQDNDCAKKDGGEQVSEGSLSVDEIYELQEQLDRDVTDLANKIYKENKQGDEFDWDAHSAARAEAKEIMKPEKNRLMSLLPEGVPDYQEHERQQERKKQQQAETYFSIGHGDMGEPYQVWAAVEGRVERSETYISDEDHPDYTGDSATHGTLWGHEVTDRDLKGRFEPNTGRVSVVVPDRLMFKKDHEIEDMVYREFPEATEVVIVKSFKLPHHESLWLSVFKADKPKSDCGAGEKGNVGFQQDNQCAKKDGGGSQGSKDQYTDVYAEERVSRLQADADDGLLKKETAEALIKIAQNESHGYDPNRKPHEYFKGSRADLSEQSLYHASQQDIEGDPKLPFYLGSTEVLAKKGAISGGFVETIDAVYVTRPSPKDAPYKVSEWKVSPEAKVYGMDMHIEGFDLPESMSFDDFEKIKDEIKNTVWSDDSQVQETASELANKVYNRSYDVFKDKGGVWQARKHKRPMEHHQSTMPPKPVGHKMSFNWKDMDSALTQNRKLPEALRSLGYDVAFVDDEAIKSVVALTDDAIQKNSSSLSKSSDKPKSDCGAGREGSPGFELDNDCGSKEGKPNQTPESLSEQIKTSGGYTYRPTDDSSPESGFSVSIFPEREKKMELSDVTPEVIADFIIDNMDILQSDERVHIGGWYNKKTEENEKGDNKVYLDLAVVLGDRAEAIALAKDNGQLKIFDLGEFEEIETLTPAEREKWENEQNNKSQPHFSKAKIMGRRRNRKDGNQPVYQNAGAEADRARGSRLKSQGRQANGVAAFPTHESLWLSVFKADDEPKDDCGATGGPGSRGGGGFAQGNECGSKDGGESGEATSVNPKVLEWAKKEFGDDQVAENFVSWFGDSELVDENGEPLVLYHGSKADIEEFDPSKKRGFKYGDSLSFFAFEEKFASDWAMGKGGAADDPLTEQVKEEMYEYKHEWFDERIAEPKQRLERNEITQEEFDKFSMDLLDRTYEAVKDKFGYRDAGKTNVRVYPVHISAKKVFRPEKHADLVKDVLIENGWGQSIEKKEHLKGHYLMFERKNVVDKIKQLGFDAMILDEDTWDDKGMGTVAVWDSRQVKSSIGNEGTFDPDNPKINKSLPTHESLWLSVFKANDPCGAGSAGGQGFSQGNSCQKRGSGNTGNTGPRGAESGEKTGQAKEAPETPDQAPEAQPEAQPEAYSQETLAFVQKLNSEPVVPRENAHQPDPMGDADGDGITDASRVGLPAHVVPPPPNQIPRMPNMTKDEAAVEEAFASKFEADPDGVTDAYYQSVVNREVNPDKPLAHKTFNTDDAKMLSGDFKESNENKAHYNIAVHQTANAIAKKAFVKHLDEVMKLPPDQRNVLITQGGVAAGKGYATGNEFNEIADKFGAVWDSAGEQNGTEMPWIQKELDERGIKATYVFVHADPVANWTNPKRGAVERAKKKGRMVDARLFAESYNIGAVNFEKFMNKNKDRADFMILDNRGPTTGRLDSIPKEDIPSTEKLYRLAVDAVNQSDAPAHIKRGATIGSRIFTNN